MSWIRRLRFRLRTVLRKGALDAEMAEELREHVELLTERYARDGMAPEEALLTARRRFGGADQISERCRDERGTRWMDGIGRAVRLAARALRKNPGFTATAVATVALCLGANLVIFAVADAVLFRPLPLADEARLVTLMNSYPLAGDVRATNSIANYYDRRGSIPAFSSVSIYKETYLTVGGADHPSRVDIALISPEFFSTLGVRLAKGRPFTEAEMIDGADGVAILTDGFWRGYFNADPNVIGRSFPSNGRATTVVGVLPAAFHFPSSRAQLYRPLAHGPYGLNPWMRHTANGGPMVARLAPGTTLADAQAQMDAFNALQLKDDPIAKIVTEGGYCTKVLPFRGDFIRAVRPILLLVECGALCLLLMGLVNLVNLLLIRANGRVREVAVRRALGAGRGHIILDSVVETFLIALGGGALGALLGYWGIRVLGSLGVDRLPLGELIGFNGRIAAASVAATVAAGLLLGLPVIGFNLGSRLAGGLQAESYGGTSGRRIGRARGVFVVAQVALSFVLLMCAGLLGMSLMRILEIPPGFTTDGIVAGKVSLPDQSYKDAKSQVEFVERLLPALRGIPGVELSAIKSGLPFTGIIPEGPFTAEGRAPRPGDAMLLHLHSAATSDYWRIMGIPLIEGRLLEDSDETRKDVVCLVDQTFARRYWPGASAVGRRLGIGLSFDKDHPITVVGVVGDVKQHELTEDSGTGSVYLPYSFLLHPVFSIVVRSSLPAAVVAPMMQKAVHQLDPLIVVADLRSMQAYVDESFVARRSPAILAGTFAAIALLLAAIGTFGVLGYAVSRRQREIGVRMALGAQPAQIQRRFLLAGLRLVAAGVAFGFLGAWAASRAMQGVLFGIHPMNGVALATTAVILVAIAVPACLLPARRAANVDPSTVLRAE